MSDFISEAHEFGWFRGIVSELLVSGLPLNARSNAYANALHVKSGPGLLFGFTVYSSNSAAQFVQIFDSQAVPASGAVPEALFTIAATSHLAVSYIFPGRFFKYGIWVVNSTSGATYTAGTADSFFDAQFA